MPESAGSPGARSRPEQQGGPEHPGAPWHFKLLVVATVLYLGWRAWQGLAWLIGRL